MMLAGKNVSNFFDGESLLPILREGKNNERKGVLGQLAGHFVYFEQRMWRRKDYKIIFNASDIGELYDIENDRIYRSCTNTTGNKQHLLAL